MGPINFPDLDNIDFVGLSYFIIAPWIILFIIFVVSIIKLLLNIFKHDKSIDKLYYPLKNKSLPLDKINIIFENSGTLMKIENMNKNKDVAISYNCGCINVYIIPSRYEITSKEKRITHYMVDRENIFNLTIIHM